MTTGFTVALRWSSCRILCPLIIPVRQKCYRLPGTRLSKMEFENAIRAVMTSCSVAVSEFCPSSSFEVPCLCAVTVHPCEWWVVPVTNWLCRILSGLLITNNGVHIQDSFQDVVRPGWPRGPVTRDDDDESVCVMWQQGAFGDFSCLAFSSILHSLCPCLFVFALLSAQLCIL